MKKSAPYRHLGELRNTPYVVYLNNRRIDSEDWDETLFMETSDDLYVLGSQSYKDKRVRLVRKDDWKKSPIIIEPNLKCPICGKIDCRGECDEDRYLHLIWDKNETL
jgi:hypothetical protein